MSKKYYNKLQKEIFIELKTLEYYLWNKNKAKALFELRHKLTSRWFELYIKYWLKKLWYKMSNFTWWNKADWWIDLKWEYKWFKVYVQCKKYIKNSNYKWKVSISDIRNFYAWVASLYNWNIENKKIFMLFATTWDYTDTAIEFAKKNNMKLLNFEKLADRLEKYSLKDFFQDFKWDINNIINKNYITNSLIDFSINDLQQEDLFNYFKNIREYIRKKITIKKMKLD
jgi:hypothetical protein